METPVAHIVVVRRNGKDGGRFPLAKAQAVIGRSLDCDIRIQLPSVSQNHARLSIQNNRVFLEHVSEKGRTDVIRPAQSLHAAASTKQERALTFGQQPVELPHGCVFQVTDRQFRLEYSNPQEESVKENTDRVENQ